MVRLKLKIRFFFDHCTFLLLWNGLAKSRIGCLLGLVIVSSDGDLFYFISIKYPSDVIKKKTKVLDIFNTDKKYFIKINVESSPQEIWIRIRFLDKKPDPHHCLYLYWNCVECLC